MSKSKEDYHNGQIDAFYEVGSILKYEYEGPYTQSDIEDFFDKKANKMKLEEPK